MPPKKVVRSKRKSTENTRTVRKEKPQLGMPANLKVSIPLQNSTDEEGIHIPIIKGRCPPRFKKKLDIETQIELSNSVARQQLVKEEPPVFQLDNVVIIQNPQTRRRPKNVAKKVVSTFFQNQVMDTAEEMVTSTDTKLAENTPKKKPTPKKRPEPPKRRIVTRKRLADSIMQEDAKRAKVEPETETLQTKIKLEDNGPAVDVPVEPDSCPSEQPQPSVAKPEAKGVQPSAKKPKSIIRPPQLTAKKPTARQPARKRGPKGKQDNIEAVTQSPSILDQYKKQEVEVKTNQNQQNEARLVESRKNSVGSSSNKSWTRDISSSSNNTCIGSVCSNDFVRINKKLPVLKITNIDNEVKKCNSQNVAQEIVASADVDEIDEDLSDSDSESSDSERDNSEQPNILIDANSLDLSASSPSSHFTHPRRKESSTDYAKAADKLSLTMEKLDMEIINWIGSENDVNANLVKFKDKMFDILDNEFGIITHCRRLKDILKPPKKGDIIDEICISDQDCNANSYMENFLVKESVLVEENAPVRENAPVEKKSSVEKKSPIEQKSLVEKQSLVQKESPFEKKLPVEKKTLVEENAKDFVKPRPIRKLSSTSESNISNASSEVSKDNMSEDEMPAGTSNNNPYYDHHDDDDTLSLFAESISGFESSRMNTWTASAVVSKARPVEEYIPKPVKEDLMPNTEKPTYCPTKIREDTETVASKIIPICLKQNADSTSIYKQSNSTDDAESYQDINENIDLDTRIDHPDLIKKPRLMDSYYEGLPKTKSVVFGNLCFYNLINSCRRAFYGQCRFPHMVPTSEQIKDKLGLLDERMFIQEYLLLRRWADLRRRYGMCYVEECAKRGLTRILVEMAYDFIIKARSESEEDTRLRVNTIEATLLHLNTVDLSVCEDLLKLTIHSDQVNRLTLLCDVFMATMSITQNFTRFKVVFLNLTYFMVDNDRTFIKHVVEHILERVCILPFEESIARALIQMMRLTNSDIFNNSMIGLFEKQISVNKDVFEEYTMLKTQCAFSSMLASSVMSASPPQEPPAASPDTTNLDNANKPAEEPPQPVITRTIGMNPPIIFNRASASTSPGHSRAHDNPAHLRTHDSPAHLRTHDSPAHLRTHDSPGHSRVNSDSPTSDDTVTVNVKKWRNRSIFPHLHPPPMLNRPSTSTLPLMRPPMRPQMRPPPMRMPQMKPPQMRPPQRPPHFNQRLVTFKHPSNYVSRHPGPKY